MRAACVLLALGMLAAVSSTGCRRSHGEPVAVAFEASVRGAPFSCRGEVAGFRLQDLRLFVYGFELLGADGAVTPVALADDGVWQDGEVALLDFEDGSGHCRNGTAAVRTAVAGWVPRGSYVGLRFRIGVPFERNHADPAVARPPLNLGRMHWGWRAGYKFIRFEAMVDERALRLHHGSTGCTGQVGAISGCRWPNRIVAELPEFDVRHDAVVIELGPLLAALAGGDGDGSCMAERDDPDCAAVFPVLGLGPAGEAAQPTVLVNARRGVR